MTEIGAIAARTIHAIQQGHAAEERLMAEIERLLAEQRAVIDAMLAEARPS
ncbi:hypothetical protein [Kaistia algarum]|uniref:hypothetical protein n=1 Tax=Kaistia algarum TaxID=2083279 RepID=UPI001402694D|nr:hypothetical protein [Kaistia algarum]MCX5513446.1 hypothetical protein [Kaistia algarum]